MCCFNGSALGDDRGIRRAGLRAMVRSMPSLTCCHGESLPPTFSTVDCTLRRPVGVGVLGGGDLRRSESCLRLSVRRADFSPRSDTPTSAADRDFFLVVVSSGLTSVIDSSCLVPGVLVRSGFAIVDERVSLFFSFGSPNKDWYGSFCVSSLVGDARPWCDSTRGFLPARDDPLTSFDGVSTTMWVS